MDMSVLIYPVVSGITGVLSGGLGTYVIFKKVVKGNIINEIGTDLFASVLDNVTSDTESQKKIYCVGALLGKGISDGSGLGKLTGGNGKKGKFSIEGFIGNFIADFAQQKLGGAMGGLMGEQPQTEQPQQQTNTVAPVF